MSLPTDCVHHTTVVHEFLHAFGVFHTHQRRDRDDHVTILFDNIQSNLSNQFTKFDFIQIDETITDIPYDVFSLMHYSGYNTFAIDIQKPVITSKVAILIWWLFWFGVGF